MPVALGTAWPVQLMEGGRCGSRAEGTAGRKKLRSPFHTVVLVFQLSGNSGKGTKGRGSSKGRLAAGMGTVFFAVILWERNSRGAALDVGGASNAYGMRVAQAARPKGSTQEKRRGAGRHPMAGRCGTDPQPSVGWDMGTGCLFL